MIKGLGNDIIEVSRIAQAIERYGDRFVQKVFTVNEKEYCEAHRDAERHYAGRFAAKEAIVKALGIGFGNGISWQDFEILNDEKGKPLVSFSDNLELRFDDPKVLLTISHCREYASAVALWIL